MEDATLHSRIHAALFVLGSASAPAHLVRAALLNDCGGAPGVAARCTGWLRAPTTSDVVGEGEALVVSFLQHATADTVLAPALRGTVALLLRRLQQLCASRRPSTHASISVTYCLTLCVSNVVRQGMDLGDVHPPLVLDCLVRAAGHSTPSVAALALDTLREYLARQPAFERKGHASGGVEEGEGGDTGGRGAHVVRDSLHSPVGAALSTLYATNASQAPPHSDTSGGLQARQTLAGLAERCITAWFAASSAAVDGSTPHARVPSWLCHVLHTALGRLAASGLAGKSTGDAAYAVPADGPLLLFAAACRAFGTAILTVPLPLSARGGVKAGTGPDGSAPPGQLFAAFVRLTGVQVKLLSDEADDLLLRPLASVTLPPAYAPPGGASRQSASTLRSTLASGTDSDAGAEPAARPAARHTTYVEQVRAESATMDVEGEEEEGSASAGVAGARPRPRKPPVVQDPAVRLSQDMPSLVHTLYCAASAFRASVDVLSDAASAQGAPHAEQLPPAQLLSLRDSFVHTSRVCLQFLADCWTSDLRGALLEGEGRDEALLSTAAESRAWVTLAAPWARRAAAPLLCAACRYLEEDDEALHDETVGAVHLALQLGAGDVSASAPHEVAGATSWSPLPALLTVVASRLEGVHLIASRGAGRGPKLLAALWEAPGGTARVLAWLLDLTRALSLSAMEAQAVVQAECAPVGGGTGRYTQRADSPAVPHALTRGALRIAICGTTAALHVLSDVTSAPASATSPADGASGAALSPAHLLSVARACVLAATRVSGQAARAAVAAAGSGTHALQYLSQLLLAVAGVCLAPASLNGGGSLLEEGEAAAASLAERGEAVREQVREAAFELFRGVLPAATTDSNATDWRADVDSQSDDGMGGGGGSGASVSVSDLPGLQWVTLTPIELLECVLDGVESAA